MTTTLFVLATAAALLALAFWWIRRNNLAVYPAGRAPRELRPLSTGCDLGAQLMAATTAGQAGGSVDTRSSGATPTTSGPAALKRQRKRVGPSRRDFLRTGLLAAMGGVLVAFGGASLAFLWPSLRGGFGARIDVGSQEEVAAAIADGGRLEYPAGRSYLVAYDESLDDQKQYVELTNGAPFMALYQRCVHLGCRVPWCESSQWFECPCHGSRYNRWGEYQFGPAPRGLDRFATFVEQGRVIVDTSTVVTGPSRGSGSLNQSPEGPHCQ